jgi:hypothetical protein
MTSRRIVTLLSAAVAALGLQSTAQAQACTDVPAFSPYVNGRSGERRAGNQHDITEGVNTLVAEARRQHIDPCIVLTIATAESGGDPAAIGHDENNSASPTCQAKLQRCHAAHGHGGAHNDDTPSRSAGDLGLDWRFTHGLGIGQTTIGPRCADSGCNPSPNPTYRLQHLNPMPSGASQTLTAHDLVSLPGSIYAAVDEIKAMVDYVTQHKPSDLDNTPETIAMLTFTRYGGHFPCFRASGPGGATLGRMETWRRCNTRGADCIARWLINGGRRAGGTLPRNLQSVTVSTAPPVVQYATDHHYLTSAQGEDARHDHPHCAIYGAHGGAGASHGSGASGHSATSSHSGDAGATGSHAATRGSRASSRGSSGSGESTGSTASSGSSSTRRSRSTRRGSSSDSGTSTR